MNEREYFIYGINIDLVYVNKGEREFSILILHYLKVLKNTPHVLKRKSTQCFVTFTLWGDEGDFDTVNGEREKHAHDECVKKGRILPKKSSVPLSLSHEERNFDMCLRQIGGHYCKKELDYMKDKGLPALPFHDSLRNMDPRIRKMDKRKRRVPDWVYTQ